MFERFFGQKSEEQREQQIEKSLFKIADKQLEDGVNSSTMYLALKALMEENETKGLGIHKNRLLNIVRDSALANASAIEDTLMGGSERVEANIMTEIEKLRKKITQE